MTDIIFGEKIHPRFVKAHQGRIEQWLERVKGGRTERFCTLVVDSTPPLFHSSTAYDPDYRLQMTYCTLELTMAERNPDTNRTFRRVVPASQADADLIADWIKRHPPTVL